MGHVLDAAAGDEGEVIPPAACRDHREASGEILERGEGLRQTGQREMRLGPGREFLERGGLRARRQHEAPGLERTGQQRGERVRLRAGAGPGQDPRAGVVGDELERLGGQRTGRIPDHEHVAGAADLAMLLGGAQDHPLGLVGGGELVGRLGLGSGAGHEVSRAVGWRAGTSGARPGVRHSSEAWARPARRSQAGMPRRPRERRRPPGSLGAGSAAGVCGAKGPNCSSSSASPPHSRTIGAIGASSSASSTPISAW